MLKKLFNLRSVLLALCILSPGIIAHAQPYAWAVGLEGPASSRGTRGMDVVVDNAGNVYMTGLFYDTVDFDPGPGVAKLVSIPNPNNMTEPDGDIYLAKYDAHGNYLWAKRMGGKNAEVAQRMTIDKNGNIYLVGNTFSDTADFDPGPRVANLLGAGEHIFFAKYDSSGNYLWAKTIANGNADVAYGIAVDDDGALYISGKVGTGSFGADFDPGPGVAMLNSGNGDRLVPFFAKYDADGNYVWAKCVDNTWLKDGRFYGWGVCYSVALDGRGHVYFVGDMNGIMDFDPGADTAYLGGGTQSPGWNSAFITKYDTDGNYMWADAISGIWTQRGSNQPAFHDLVVDEAGYLYICGMVFGVVDFDRGPGIADLGKPGLRNGIMMMAKYDSNFNYVWGASTGDQFGTTYSRVITRNGSNLYLAGNFDGIVDFDPGPGVANLRSLGGGMGVQGDAFVAKYDTSGNYLCAQAISGLDGENAHGITTDRQGNVYVTGDFEGTADFDPGPEVVNLVNPFRGSTSYTIDAFLLKLACKDSITHLTVSLCSGEDRYTLNDSTYTTSGIYTQLIPNGSSNCGCDSTIQLNLTFGTMIKPEITIDKFTLGLTSTYITYQWFKDGVAIPGATGSQYVVSDNADYTVVVTNDEGCTDTSAIYRVTNTAIRDLADLAHQIRIYPNPAADIVYIQRPAHLALSVRVTGIEGKEILNAGNAKSISLKEFSSGIYFITIADQEGNLIKIEKVVKQ